MKNGKSVLPGNFIKHKPLISEECYVIASYSNKKYIFLSEPDNPDSGYPKPSVRNPKEVQSARGFTSG